MDNPKKSFVLYLDNWPELEMLDMQQRGLVMTVVFEYAGQLANGEGADLFALMDRWPELSDGGRMACGFLCTTLERDHLKWLQRKKSRQLRQATAADAGPDRQAREDMERIRKLMAQRE